MSDAALNAFKTAIEAQHIRNEARRIRTRVAEARRSPRTAGLRWPFELLQNAIDSGPRNGQESVTVSLACTDGHVVFEHDGAPFQSLELAALLSGGSSKEFESEQTTGRFGTGFLVTHVLAEQTELRGLLAVGEGHEVFDLTLDRTGDETAILDNITKCNDAIRAAQPAVIIDSTPSARFSYPTTDNSVLTLGFDAFRRALPYLYGTRPLLGKVALTLPDGTVETWTPCTTSEYAHDGTHVEDRTVSVNGTELRVLRVTRPPHRTAAAVVVLERDGEQWRVRVPDDELPRVFREYPVRGATFFPINVVLDGKFNVDQERNRLLMDEADKLLVGEALEAATSALKLACEQLWRGRHWLAKAAIVAAGFDAQNATEVQWWRCALNSFAQSAAALPLVETKAGCLPVSGGAGVKVAAFVLPRLLPTSTADETTIERLWPLVDAARDLTPPVFGIAADWTAIVEGWNGLGLQPVRINVKRLGIEVRKDVTAVADLRVSQPPADWLANYIDIVGECWQRRNGIDQTALDGLLPNQRGTLCSPGALRRDAGVSSGLKDICAAIGLNIREQLLTTELHKRAEDLGLTFLPATLSKAIPQELTEDNALEQCVQQLDKLLPADSKFTEKQNAGLHGSIQLVQHIRATKGETGGAYARRLPLVTEDLAVTRWSKDRMLMAPIAKWHRDAQPFALAYPEGRLLLSIYAGRETPLLPDVVGTLVEWGICYADPLSRNSPAELKERRLAALSVDPTQVEGCVVSGQEFVQIALLQPEVLNRCQEGRDEAKALLGLAVCYMARYDQSWRDTRLVKAKKAGEGRELEVRGALWLADLTYRAWVPVPGEDGKFTKAAATLATLRDLIDPAWLTGNADAIALLSQWFGFDELELRLLGTAPVDADRQKLRNGLAKLVELAGSDPATYESIAQKLHENQRRAKEVERCRRLGLAIQEAVKSALEACGLALTLVDRGFDYEVAAASDDPLSDAAFRFAVGSYLLEVKATTHGDARLTPLQAETAAKEAARYILCVVDLRGVAAERLDGEWMAADVEPLAKVVTDIGVHAKETCVLVDLAKSQEVGIRNETALRYVVAAEVWTTGTSISDWVKSIGSTD